MYHAKTNSLNKFIEYLKEYLLSSKSINVPSTSIFVLPEKTIKENSFRLFKDLGTKSKGYVIDGKKVWAEIYGFDDGAMPSYELAQNRVCPFYGLQEVNPIKISPNLPFNEILQICREKSKSEKFLIIDKYQKLSENFVAGLIAFKDSQDKEYEGYKIYSK